MVERAIDCERDRNMRCDSCHHGWRVDAVWLDRFNQALESCSKCSTDCQTEERPDFCAE